MTTSNFKLPRLRHAVASLLIAIAFLLPFRLFAQASNLNYTKDYPSVDRVKAEIKGSDPDDTLARQSGVFTYLTQEIKRIKLNRDYRGPYTPDEQRLMHEYDVAAYEITQNYKKSHTPAEFEVFDRLQFNYAIDPAFRADWTRRLIGAQGQSAYTGAQNDLAAIQKRHFDAEMHQYEQDKAAMEAAAKGQSGASNDPTAVATRRCLELGGDAIACMGKSVASGLMSLIGFDTESITGPGKVGVVLNGNYRNPAALPSLSFSDDTVAIASCGKLVADGHGYSISKGPNSLQITVANEPRPLILTMRPDGGLTGPGLVDIKGRIIIGHHTVTKTLYVNGQVAVGGSCGGGCSTTESVPDYAPKIERCTIGGLNPPPPPAPRAASPSNGDGPIGALIGFMGTIAPPAVPGLRMVGQYTGSGGFYLVFDPSAVILDCGPAHVKQPYTVRNTPNQIVINVENAGGPFALSLQPDNTLRGSASTTVNGRLVSGTNDNNVTYVPRSNTCQVGTLSPKAGTSTSNAIAASAHE